MHPHDDALHAFADGELATQRAADLSAHLETCAECRVRMVAIRVDTAAVFSGLAALDSAVPDVPFGRIAERAIMRPHNPKLWRWAAAAVVALTLSGLAVAAPSSPVGNWLRAFFRAGGARDIRPTVPALTAKPTPPSGEALDRTGVTIYPGDSLRIEFARWQVAGEMTVTLVDSAPVTVRTTAGAATFSVSSTVLGVDNSGRDTHFDLWIPRRTSYIEIRVAGHRVYRRTRVADDIGSTGDTIGVRHLSLARNAAPSQTRR